MVLVEQGLWIRLLHLVKRSAKVQMRSFKFMLINRASLSSPLLPTFTVWLWLHGYLVICMDDMSGHRFRRFSWRFPPKIFPTSLSLDFIHKIQKLLLCMNMLMEWIWVALIISLVWIASEFKKTCLSNVLGFFVWTLLRFFCKVACLYN